MEGQANRLNAKWSWSRLFLALALVGAVSGAFVWGRLSSSSEATAAPPQDSSRLSHDPVAKAGPANGDADYSHRVVAYINGSMPITREDLGEYLIARQGAERVELMVNRRIIEEACKQKGIVVTDVEVEAALEQDLKGMSNLSLKEFVNNVLKKYQKTLYEWKEDVIWPKLALTKLCIETGRVKITEEDVHKAFEAYHGEKVDCQLIIWPPAEKNKVLTDIYAKIRDNPAEFELAAKSQASSALAAQGGHVPPFGRNTTGNEEMEREAFALRPGDISRVIETPQGLVVVKCLRHIPPEKGVSLESERAKLEKEIRERKITLEIPKLFKELKDQARPQIFLIKTTTMEDIEREVKEALSPVSGNPALPIHTPKGN
jgi:hypothetical protein